MAYSKGKTIHRTKASAQNIARQGRAVGVPSRIVKLAKGYRVDKKWS